MEYCIDICNLCYNAVVLKKIGKKVPFWYQIWAKTGPARATPKIKFFFVFFFLEITKGDHLHHDFLSCVIFAAKTSLKQLCSHLIG